MLKGKWKEYENYYRVYYKEGNMKMNFRDMRTWIEEMIKIK